MKTGFLEDKLNALCSRGALSGQNSSFREVRFYCGNYKDSLKKITDKVCPSGRAAIFSKQGKSEELSSSLGLFFKDTGIRISEMIFPSDIVADVDRFCKAFNLPEDVRAVIVTDNSLADIGAYFARVRNIPLIIMLTRHAACGLFRPDIIIKNGKKFDLVEVPVKRHVVIDLSLLAGDFLSSAFACIMGRLPALTDYRIYGALTGARLNSAAYDLAREAVTEAYSKCSENRFDVFTALKSIFSLDIAGAAEPGMFFGSSTEAVKRLMNPYSCECFPQTEMFAALKIIRLYALWAKTDASLPESVDYISRAEKISEILDADENFILYRLSEQVKKIASDRKIAGRIKKNLAGELSGLVKSMSAAERFYYSLGGVKPSPKEMSRLSMSIRLAGDEPFALNGLSLLREEGFLEPV